MKIRSYLSTDEFRDLREHYKDSFFYKVVVWGKSKLFLLAVIIILSYYLFSRPVVVDFLGGLRDLSYFGVFIAGMMFSFGFTAPLAVGFFITLHPENVFIAAIMGGFGSLISDVLIFRFIKVSFMDEFKAIKSTQIFCSLKDYYELGISKKIRNALMYAFAGIVIASPLPDELGVSMLAGLTAISERKVATLGFILNTLGILVILYFSM